MFDCKAGFHPGLEWPVSYTHLGKITENRNIICKTESFYLDDADIALIAYGSEVRPALDAVQMARNDGKKVGLLKLATVWPVPEEQIRLVAENVGTVVTVEMNIGRYAYEVERIYLYYLAPPGCHFSRMRLQ